MDPKNLKTWAGRDSDGRDSRRTTGGPLPPMQKVTPEFSAYFKVQKKATQASKEADIMGSSKTHREAAEAHKEAGRAAVGSGPRSSEDIAHHYAEAKRHTKKADELEVKEKKSHTPSSDDIRERMGLPKIDPKPRPVGISRPLPAIAPKDDIFAAKNKLDNDEFIEARRTAEAKSKLADQSKKPADYLAAAAAHREAAFACVGGVKDKERNKAHHKDEADAYKAKAAAVK